MPSGTEKFYDFNTRNVLTIFKNDKSNNKEHDASSKGQKSISERTW